MTRLAAVLDKVEINQIYPFKAPFLDQPDDRLLLPEQTQNYLIHLSKTREEWQVKEAVAALRRDL
jgi:hypothetical protein